VQESIVTLLVLRAAHLHAPHPELDVAEARLEVLEEEDAVRQEVLVVGAVLV